MTKQEQAERIVMDKETAADFGQMMCDAIISHIGIPAPSDGELSKADLAEGYIRVWQGLKTDLAARDIQLRAASAALDAAKDYADENFQAKLAEYKRVSGT